MNQSEKKNASLILTLIDLIALLLMIVIGSPESFKDVIITL